MMAITFSADEIFEMAEQIERNGAKYYRQAAKGTSSVALKKSFEELAEKDSIVFYLGLEHYVPGQCGKDKIRAIIKQEMGHIVLLKDKLAY